MHSPDSVRDDVRQFLVAEFLFGNKASLPSDESSLVEAGIIDSTGVLELIEFIEDRFAISVDEAETVPENLGSISGLSNYVSFKLNGRGLGE